MAGTCTPTPAHASQPRPHSPQLPTPAHTSHACPHFPRLPSPAEPHLPAVLRQLAGSAVQMQSWPTRALRLPPLLSQNKLQGEMGLGDESCVQGMSPEYLTAARKSCPLPTVDPPPTPPHLPTPTATPPVPRPPAASRTARPPARRTASRRPQRSQLRPAYSRRCGGLDVCAAARRVLARRAVDIIARTCEQRPPLLPPPHLQPVCVGRLYTTYIRVGAIVSSTMRYIVLSTINSR
eukprot:356896-Chlamydomonas_euryale.AAC.1